MFEYPTRRLIGLVTMLSRARYVCAANVEDDEAAFSGCPSSLQTPLKKLFARANQLTIVNRAWTARVVANV